jgi:hypothetical protein
LFGHQRPRQAQLGRAEIDRGQEGHSHRRQGPSAGKNRFACEGPGMGCRGASTGTATNPAACGSLPGSQVMGAILPAAASRELSHEAFSAPALLGYLCKGYNQVGKLQRSDDAT